MITSMRAAVLSAPLLLISCSQRSSDPRPTRPARSSDVVLTAEDIEHAPGQSLEQLLLAHVPGLTLSRNAEGRMVLHLRGTSTFMGEDEPLFVVNDVPLGPGSGGNLSAINPRDIDWVKVLRDAAATAAYGVRGANGVIVIRTKT